MALAFPALDPRPGPVRAGSERALLVSEVAVDVTPGLEPLSELPTWKRCFTTLAPEARQQHAMAYDAARCETLLFGGVSRGLFGDTWRWNGRGWRRAAVHKNGPSPRSGHAMAFDALRGEIVLFGGRDTHGLRNDTWAWDGLAWHEKAPATRPQPRGHAAMTFDASRGEVVLLGGRGVRGTFDDVWIWTGCDWVARPSQSPNPGVRSTVGVRSIPRVYGHALAHLRHAGQTVTFGGLALAPATAQDGTHVFDGLLWQRHDAVVGPSARYGHAMVYDEARRLVVLFGGDHPNALLSDTWLWDGEEWREQATQLHPSERRDHAMVFDDRRGEVVLFAGTTDAGVLDDTWILV